MKAPILFLVSAALAGCDNGVEWNDPPYQVQWIDIAENRSLSYQLDDGASIGRVSPVVIAVGSDSHFVVAKRKPLGSESFEYYYVKKVADSAAFGKERAVFGPFTEDEFSSLAGTLNLPGLSEEFE